MVLRDVGQPASEVDEGLVAHVRTRGRAEMNHGDTRPESDLPPEIPGPATPVDILVVDEEALVEKPDGVQALAPHEEEASTDPVDVALRQHGAALGRHEPHPEHIEDAVPGAGKGEARGLHAPRRVGVEVADPQDADVRMRVHVAYRLAESVADLNGIVVQ